MKKIALIALLAISALAFNQSGKAGDLDVSVSTDKPIFVGENKFKIKITKAGKNIKDAIVKLKVWMPEMPGMPAMGEEVDAKINGETYEAVAPLMMNGGWQITISAKEKEQKPKKYKFNINL